MTTAPPRTLPAAALWDLDGTIIDSEPIWARAELAMLDRFGLSFPEGGEHMLVGLGLTAAARIFQDLGVPLTTSEIIEEWADGVVAGLAEGGHAWRPGARELLAELGERGVPNVLVTMSVRRIADAVAALLPEGTFAEIIAGDEVEHEKPHPDPYLRAVTAAGAAPRDCIAFEDSHTGTASASAAGVFVVGVPNLVPLEGSSAHRLLPSLAGLDVDAAAALWSDHRSRGAGRDERSSHE